MLLRKTDKGRDELKPGVRELGLRERGLLLLMDGQKTLADVQGMFNGEAEKVALSLLQRGYLEKVDAVGLGFNPNSTGTFSVRTGVFMASALQQQAPPPSKP
jgi:hypothetical protein